MQRRFSSQGAIVVFSFLIGFWAVSASSSGGPREPVTLRTLYGLTPPARLRASHTAVVLVDFQREFISGKLPLPGASRAIERAGELSAWARRTGVLVVLVRNVVTRAGSPLFTPGAPTTDFVPELAPQASDLVVQKSMVGAFSHTTLDAELRARGIDTLIVAGFMTHLAVLATASDATVLGYHVVVASDATATRALPGADGDAVVTAPVVERAALAVIADRVADVLPVRAISALPFAEP